MRIVDVQPMLDKLPKSLISWLLAAAIVVLSVIGGTAVWAQIDTNQKASVQRHDTHDEVHELTSAIKALTAVVAANQAQAEENRLDVKEMRERFMEVQVRLERVLVRIENGLDIG